MTNKNLQSSAAHTFPEKWIPVSFDEASDRVRWVYAGNKHFDESFFEDSIKVVRQTYPEIRQTGMAELLQLNIDAAGRVQPTSFIFHISRCGSTLVTQMLSQSLKNIVYAEPPLLDDILSSQLPSEQKVLALQKAIAVMGQRRNPDQQHLFVKWDSWHLGFYELIREAFPEAPVLFLYRQPLDVLKSHCKMRGRHMVPGMLKADIFNIKGIPLHDLDGYSTAVLSQLFQWMILYGSDENIQLVNYSALPDKLFDVISRLGLCYSPDEVKAMQQRTKTHSKQLLKDPQPNYPLKKEQLERLEALSLPLNRLYRQLESIVSSR